MNLDLMDNLLRGILGGRRKRSRGALRFLTGRRGGSLLSNPQTLLAAAGVAWGIFETMQGKGSPSGLDGGQGGQGGPVSPGPMPTASPAPSSSMPPPLPVTSAPPASGGVAAKTSTPMSADALRLLRLVISAAHADGSMNEQERAAVVEHARAAGAADIVATELAQPRPLAEIVAGVSDASGKATLYVLAYTVLRADEQISGAERIYLAQLAHLLGLTPEFVATLEKDTGQRIDALGDQGQLGG